MKKLEKFYLIFCMNLNKPFVELRLRICIISQTYHAKINNIFVLRYVNDKYFEKGSMDSF